MQRRGAVFITYGQPPTSSGSGTSSGPLSGLSSVLKLVGFAAIAVVVSAGVFVAAEAARPVIADIQQAERGRRR